MRVSIGVRLAGALLAGGCDMLGGGGDQPPPAPPPPPAEPVVSPAPPAELDEEGAPKPPPEVQGPLPESGTFAIGGLDSLPAIALRFRRLWRAGHGAGARIAEVTPGRHSLLAPDGASPDDARARAGSIDLAAVAVDPPADMLEPTVVRTTVSLNVRAEPTGSGDLRRTLPARTIAIALLGRVAGQDSRAGGPGNWSYVVVSREHQGFAASRYLEPYEGCLPLPVALLADVPSGRRAAVRRDLTYTTAEVRHRGRSVPALLLLGRDAEQDVSHLGVHRDEGGCRVEELGYYRIGGIVEDVMVTSTERRGGDTLLVTLSPIIDEDMPDDLAYAGHEYLRAYRLGADEPVLETRERTGQSAPDNVRWRVTTGGSRTFTHVEGWWPVVLEPSRAEASQSVFPTYYAWEGGRLVVFDPLENE